MQTKQLSEQATKLLHRIEKVKKLIPTSKFYTTETRIKGLYEALCNLNSDERPSFKTMIDEIGK